MDSLNDEDDQNILSDLRDEPTSFYFQELQSTYVKTKFIFYHYSTSILDLSNGNAVNG
jgi:hypothetical protein